MVSPTSGADDESISVEESLDQYEWSEDKKTFGEKIQPHGTPTEIIRGDK